MSGYINLMDAEIEELRHAMLWAFRNKDKREATRCYYLIQGFRRARNLAVVYMAVREGMVAA